MNREDLAAKMRARIKLCRNLADSTHDQVVAAELRAMADEGQRDLDRMMQDGID